MHFLDMPRKLRDQEICLVVVVVVAVVAIVSVDLDNGLYVFQLVVHAHAAHTSREYIKSRYEIRPKKKQLNDSSEKNKND